MRLTAHIVWKDLRQDKWALLLWLALYPLHVGIGHALLHADGIIDLPWIDSLRIGGMLLAILQFVIGYLLALRWVQADELAGTRMFWVTRPISAARLFAAKAAGLLLVFGLLPVMLWLPWWFACGLGAREICWLAVETLGRQLLVIGPALLIGSLTADFGRAIMWSLILAIAMVAWSIIGQSTLTATAYQQFVRWYPGIWFSRLFLGGVLLVLGSFLLAATQFLTRNVVRTMAFAAAWALLIVMVGRSWRLDFSDAFDRPGDAQSAEQVPGLDERIALSFRKAKLSTYPYKRYTKEGPENIHSLLVTFDVAGLPSDLVLGGVHRFQELQWSDGPVVRSTSGTNSFSTQGEETLRRQLSLPAPIGDPETVRWGQARLKKANEIRAARGLPPLEDHWIDRLQPPEPPGLAIRFELPESALARIQAEAPSYFTEMKAKVGRMEVIQVVPLTPGSRGEGSLRSLRVVEVADSSAKLVETVPAYRRVGLFGSRVGQRRPNPDRPTLRAVNTVTGDIDYVSGRNLVPNDIAVGGVEIKLTEAAIGLDQWSRNGQWVLKDPDWVVHTQIVVLIGKEVGSFTREIRVDHLTVQFPKPKQSGAAQPGSGAEAVGN